MFLRKNKFIFLLGFFILIIIINYQFFLVEYLKLNGYQVFENQSVKYSNFNNYTSDFENPKYSYFVNSSTNIILLNGRNSTFESMKSGTDYTRNLFTELKSFSNQNNFNFIFFEVGSDLYDLGNLNSNQIDLNRLDLFLKTLNEKNKTILIGMSYGGIISEYISNFFPNIKVISIGGSIRENEFSFNKYSNTFDNIKFNTNKNIINVIGSKDGNFENYIKRKDDKIFIYKGHHYITDEAISILKEIITDLK